MGNIRASAIQMNDAARASTSKAPLRKIRTWSPKLDVDRRSDGTITIRQAGELGPYPANITSRLAHWAAVAPDRIFLADRSGQQGAWRKVSYAEAFSTVRRLAQALLTFGLSAERPLLILSGNDIEHALLGLAACH